MSYSNNALTTITVLLNNILCVQCTVHALYSISNIFFGYKVTNVEYEKRIQY